MGSNPQLVILAGPNGAGKSTLADRVLSGALDVAEFVNADVIARGLSGFHPEHAAFQAGRLMLQRLQELARSRASFAFETTLASRSFAPWITQLTKSGYRFRLIYLWLPNADEAIARVKARVRLGGHSVPEAVIKRRYSSGLRNFFELYEPIASDWRFYDNSSLPAPKLVAAKAGRRLLVREPRLWSMLREEYRRD